MNSQHNILHTVERLGVIEQVIGLKLVANGPPLSYVGEVCELLDKEQRILTKAEVIGFNEGKVYLMPYDVTPLCMGYQVRALGASLAIKVDERLLGHTVNAFAEPLDHPIGYCSSERLTQNKRINPLKRAPVTEQLVTGVTAIDALLPFGKGQRLGLFSGSGVGKSTLLITIAQHIKSDVTIIALIGERGREVAEFVAQLDENTRKKSIIIAACSDESALTRRQAAFSATTLAEYFCERGKDVVLLMDSVTRLAMAQREIGLSLGEPPTARGYTPSVFALLPGLIERAGNFIGKGSISALYTILVEGDDFNEPLADHLRALLDGHIVLSRELAQAGHYPPIAVLQSVSRLSHALTNDLSQKMIKDIIVLLAVYEQNKELIHLGAYKTGNNPDLDRAMHILPHLNRLLTQKELFHDLDSLSQRFREILQ